MLFPKSNFTLAHVGGKIFCFGGLTIAAEKKNRVNNEISAAEVRVIGLDGKQLGILSRDEALKLAEQEELDLLQTLVDQQRKRQGIQAPTDG